LPALTLAREAANRTACAAKLQQIMIAAQVHAIEHQGFYPLAGLIKGPSPADFNDPNANHYDYINYLGYNIPNLLAPISMGLATEMGYRNVLEDATTDPSEGNEETDAHGFIRHFLCPSQASNVNDLYQVPLLYSLNPSNGDWCYYTQAGSYIFNEAILGYDDGFGRLRGQASQVRQQAKSMFAADGLGGSTSTLRTASFAIFIRGLPMLTVYNNVSNPPVTLADALTARTVNGVQLAGDPENFDLHRHRGKMNIAFCDGHVETRNITAADLNSVYLLAP
jgi:prepilin-type processing-associated H-X9-DG protein